MNSPVRSAGNDTIEMGKDRISFSAYIGMQQKASEVKVMNASQYAMLFDEAGYNADTAYMPPVLKPRFPRCGN